MSASTVKMTRPTPESSISSSSEKLKHTHLDDLFFCSLERSSALGETSVQANSFDTSATQKNTPFVPLELQGAKIGNRSAEETTSMRLDLETMPSSIQVKDATARLVTLCDGLHDSLVMNDSAASNQHGTSQATSSVHQKFSRAGKIWVHSWMHRL